MASRPETDPFLSVSQFAAREGVSRARVLQLLAAQRIAGARRIGHGWAIPASAGYERRPPGRPLRRGAGDTTRLLREMAGKYVWWLFRDEAVRRPDLIAVQVMEMGDYDDMCRFETAVSRAGLVRVLSSPDASRLSPRSWAYWHHRLGLAPSGRVPAQPGRRLR